jgi:hypothetical protein
MTKNNFIDFIVPFRIAERRSCSDQSLRCPLQFQVTVWLNYILTHQNQRLYKSRHCLCNGSIHFLRIDFSNCHGTWYNPLCGL